MLESLDLKEKMAIELKYLGNLYRDISEKIDVPLPTVESWFKAEGKLLEDYQVYVKKANKMRDSAIVNEFIETDENVAKLTTNVMRQFASQIQNSGKRVMVVDKDNKPVLIKGLPTVFIVSNNLKPGDLEKMWKMQRVLSNRNTDTIEHELYDKREIEGMVDKARNFFRSKSDEEEAEEKVTEEKRLKAIKEE